MDISSLIQAGTTHPLLLFFFSLILGALHALEPGHSKTMIASYIIAIQGKVSDAILLGLSSAISHSILIWVLALLALTYGDAFLTENTEGYFLILSGALIVLMGGWMIWQRWHYRKRHDHTHHHHDHNHIGDGFDDAHEAHHAKELSAQLSGKRVTRWQTIMFGITGGLMPCPAALTVLILCYQLKKVTLGLVLLSAFSLGLGIMMVLVGVATALGLSYLTQKKSFSGKFIKIAPLVSAGLICLIGVLIIWSGVVHLP